MGNFAMKRMSSIADLVYRDAWYNPLTLVDPTPFTRVDPLGFGRMVDGNDTVMGSNPMHHVDKDGLTLGVTRPATVTVGSWKSLSLPRINPLNPVPVHTITDDFLLVAEFSRVDPPVPPSVIGLHAVSILMTQPDGSTTKPAGVSAQFKHATNDPTTTPPTPIPAGIRLALPGSGNQNKPIYIRPDLYQKVIDPVQPAFLTLMLHVRASLQQAEAFIYVDNDLADSMPFSFAAQDGISGFRAAIGITGGNYTATARLWKFEIWNRTLP